MTIRVHSVLLTDLGLMPINNSWRITWQFVFEESTAKPGGMLAPGACINQ